MDTQKQQCVAARNDDHKATADLKTQSSSPDGRESGLPSLLYRKPPQVLDEQRDCGTPKSVF